MAPSMQLAPHPSIPKPEGPVMVCILDGWGVNVEDQYNAVFSADTPTTDKLRAVPGRYRSVKAHGTAVGLPSDADMGNSEVGHNALGSGQVVDQGARLVDLALSTGKMFDGAGWKLISEAFPSHTVHFIGLLSDGGVHSRYDQLIGSIRLGGGAQGRWGDAAGVEAARAHTAPLAGSSHAWHTLRTWRCAASMQASGGLPCRMPLQPCCAGRRWRRARPPWLMPASAPAGR
jgi:hypothetical protein